MKNQTKSTGAGSLNESPLMWLKTQGYHQNHSAVKTVKKEGSAGFSSKAALIRFKRNINDLWYHVIHISYL